MQEMKFPLLNVVSSYTRALQPNNLILSIDL